MADNIFNRVGSDLSENAIRGIVDEEIEGHKKEEAELPIIKLKLPSAESTVQVKGKEGGREPGQTVDIPKKKPSDSIFHVLSSEKGKKAPSKPAAPKLPASLARQLPDIKLPESLSQSAKLRKKRRFRRYGIPLRMKQVHREATPLPEVKKEDVKKMKWYRFKKEFLGSELLLPALLIFMFFSWFPIIKTFIISLRSYSTINESVFIGFANFARIVGDIKFWEAFFHSLTLSVFVILLGTWLPLMLALYVYEMQKGSGLMKVLYFIPFLTPAVPAAILWKWMYNQGFGLINSFLSVFTPGTVNIGWLTDSKLVLLSIAIVFVWKNAGWAMLIYLAGMQNIPKNLFEEASLNGADIWIKIKEVILPVLKPVIMAVVFIQVISGMQVFSEVYIMTNGGPQGSSEVIATYMYKKAFLYMDIGYASGVAVFFLFILVSITLFRMTLAGRKS